MVLLQRSWPCSRCCLQPTALPRAREGPWPNAFALNGRCARSRRLRPDVHTCSSSGASGGRTVRRCVCASELQPYARVRAVTTLRRVASQQPMAPAPPSRLHVNASPHPANGARRCPSRAPGRRRASMSLPRPPSRPRAPMPRLFHRGGAHRRSWAPPHPADGLGRGTVGTSMLPLA